MLDITLRESFMTVGELRDLLSNWSDDTPVSICGERVGWFHAGMDNPGITLDYSSLDEAYGGAV